MNRLATFIAASLIAACSEGKAPAPVDSTPPAAVPDTVAAMALRDSATATVATLLDAPDRARFDSVIVTQPPRDGARLPGMAVCGRISGPASAKLPRSPARFVFQSKWALFVEDATNADEFAKLWASRCEGAGITVVVGR